MQPGRRIRFTDDDHQAIANGRVVGLENVASRLWLPDQPMVYRDRKGTYQPIASGPGQRYAENLEILTGRYLNDLDIEQRRKVIVLGEPVRKQLFPRW